MFPPPASIPWPCLTSAIACLAVSAAVWAQECAWEVGVESPSPSARHSNVMAYDAGRQRTVLFGGFDGSPQTGTLLGDTWEHDGTRWQQVAGSGPSPRLGSAMVYDSGRGVCVLFGGSDGSPRNDTWEWDGANWKQVGSTGPSPRSRHAMAYDSGRSVVVLFGGMPRGGDETWEWNGSQWQQVIAAGPWARDRHAMAFDKARGVTLLFGGRDRSNRLGDDTWQWNGTGWKQLAVSGPPARSRHGMVYDPARATVILFGGNRGPYLDDTWEWDGTAWRQVAAVGPSRRQYLAMAHDSTTGTTLLFGGWNGSTALADTGKYSCCSRPIAYGCETAHCNGAPALAFATCPRVGNTRFAIEVRNAVPDAPGPATSLLLISDTKTPGTALPCKSALAQGLCLNLMPIGLAALVPIDAAGQGGLPLPIPADPSLRGGRAYFQILTHHPSTGCPCMLTPSAGFSASKGWEILIQ